MNQDEIQQLIEQCHKKLILYPQGCPERKKILIQIGKLNEKRRKEIVCQQQKR